MSPILSPELQRIAVIGTHLPRQCGIASFTADLANSIDGELEGTGHVFALAMDDIPEGYRYPPRVRFQIRAHNQTDYNLAADYIISNRANVVILQHEFGIFGGPHGAHILRLLRDLRVPVLTTLHTILANPAHEQRRIIEQLARLSERLVVMSHRAEDLLRETYGVDPERIAFIPHGIPDVPFVDPNYYKDQFKAEGRRVILTFGLLSPGKGIEYMIEAMPSIVEQHPDALYMVVGATHPHLKKQAGEAYRTALHRRVVDLGLEDHVRFRNRFVDLDELVEYLGAADLYATPYLNPEQITSGTLAYAVGAGKAVVSTPYWHAQELLADGRGVLVPFRNAGALAEAIIHLFDNDVERHQTRKRAYTFCREMTWRQVARTYLNLAHMVVQERTERPRPLIPRRKRFGRPEELPEPDLRHLRALTDDVGIVQHCRTTIPERAHGYSLDDNARALVVSALHEHLYQSDELDSLTSTGLAFLVHSFDAQTGRFRNLLSYERQWQNVPGSEDCHGRALWGLGTLAALSANPHVRSVSLQLFQDAVGATEDFLTARGWAYALLGIHSYLSHYEGDATVRRVRTLLAGRLLKQFRINASPDWQWCEPMLTYSNATIPNALILSGAGMQEDGMRAAGLTALDWLCRIQKSDRGYFSFVGTHGWYPKGKERARFDQQPIEANQMCLACIEAYRATSDERWLAEARLALEWFLGRNDLNAPLYSFSTGGCFDALGPDGPNTNQGAESQLAWLIALLSFLTQVSRQALEGRAEEVEPRAPAGTAAGGTPVAVDSTLAKGPTA